MRWQLGVIVMVMAVLLWLAWRHLHAWRIPTTWPWVLGYSALISVGCEAVYQGSKVIDDVVPIHLEVLLPAFVLGCMMARPAGQNPHQDDARPGHQEGPESESEQRMSTVVSSLFMVLVGMSMPLMSGGRGAAAADGVDGAGWGLIAIHVLMVTILSNIGKMFPVFCYRTEADWRERLAVAVAMFPRGEVGAGVLIVSVSYGISGTMVTVAMLSLALNLVLTGVFIVAVEKLLQASQRRRDGAMLPEEAGEG
jgi:Kef-type K+ transport system membrane component KefB